MLLCPENYIRAQGIHRVSQQGPADREDKASGHLCIFRPSSCPCITQIGLNAIGRYWRYIKHRLRLHCEYFLPPNAEDSAGRHGWCAGGFRPCVEQCVLAVHRSLRRGTGGLGAVPRPKGGEDAHLFYRGGGLCGAGKGRLTKRSKKLRRRLLL